MALGVEQPPALDPASSSRHRKRGITIARVLILLLVLLTSTAIGYLGYQRFVPTPTAVAAKTTAAVRRGTITATISASGSTAATSQAKLAFESAGLLTALNVKVGDNVKAGDVLASLDSADLELQVSQAQVALEQAQLKLAQLKIGPKEVDVAAAQATYDTAVTKYNDLKAGPKPAELTAAQATVRDAEVALANAQDNLVVVQKSATVSKNVRDRENERNWYEVRYGETLAKFRNGQATQADLDRDYGNLLTAKEKLDSANVEAALALRKTENDVLKAQDSLNNAKTSLQTLQAGATPDQLRSAEATMLTAQSQLETKKTGTSAADIAAQEVAVRQAEAALKQKQLLLQKTTLRAPFDGIIDAVNTNFGEQLIASKEVITIVNMQQFRIDARVDESDVTRMAVGQTADVTLDALPQERLKARLVSISASPVVQQGVVNYSLVFSLDPTQAAVRPGMSATLVVVVTRRDNVLLVSNRAIRLQGRSRTVELMVDGKTETRTVTVGLSNDQSTEITDGLQEGDVVVIPTTTTAPVRVSQGSGVGGLPGVIGGGPAGPGR